MQSIVQRDARQHWFNIIQDIVKHKQASKVLVFDGTRTRRVFVDLFSASLMLQIHDKLSPENQEKFRRMSFAKAYAIALKVINSGSASF